MNQQTALLIVIFILGWFAGILTKTIYDRNKRYDEKHNKENK